ncbi:RHS repeat-associated core domain-containing protein [Streptomyces desertarenae]|uniref:RHS repeat-associated core domain-containing protein n=1 Tax=Streptomyces desertarenae TaxID=2666184 RepID=A0ABW4PGD3_9ACTN
MPQPYRFTGTYLDPTGLYKMGARYYDPHLGRFTQPDPSGHETNPYLYATGDPVNRTDPTGLFSIGDTLGISDWANLIHAAATGDDGTFQAVGTGILTFAGVEALCLTAAGLGAVPTLGASVGAGFTGCTVLAAGLGGAAAAGTKATQ